MSKRLFTDEQEKEIEKQYREEIVSTLVLAKKYNCNSTTISNVILRNGGKLRSSKEAHNIESYKQLISGENNPMFGVRGKDHPLYGIPRSDDVKRKIGDKNRGKTSWAKDQKFSDIHRKRISEGQIGRESPNKGKCLSKEHRKGISDSLSGEKHFYYGQHLSVEHRKNIGNGILLYYEQNDQGPYRDTKPELKMKEILNELNIPFKHQFRLGHCMFDFHILNTNILIEVDGDYWHSNPKKFTKLNKIQEEIKHRDVEHNKVAATNNFILLRFWEDDIMNNTEEVKNKLKNLIGGENYGKTSIHCQRGLVQL